ncbi:hypothetical protein [Rhodococcus ruber]|uniref:hypothetical protein n=1 Tax=Rhodococcus ruber TaxID=1830 RepID=UPI003D81A170
MSIRDELIAILNAEDADGFLPGPDASADAILDRFAVVELPEGEQDDDGQTYFDDGTIRVDHSGPHGAEVYVGKHSATVEWLRWHAAEYLAAARDAEAQS